MAPWIEWVAGVRFLPVLLGTLLLTIVGVLTWWSYVEIRGALVGASEVRVAAAARELSAVLSQAAEQGLNAAVQLAKEEAVVAFAAEPGPERHDAVMEAMQSTGRRNQQAAVAEIWSMDGRRLGRWLRHQGDGNGEHGALEAYEGRPPLAAGVLPFVRSGNRTLLEVAAEIHGTGQAGPIGRLVVRRPVTGGQVAALLGRLVGESATLLIGNSHDATWTDLDRARDRPPLEAIRAHAEHQGADGTRRLGAAVDIAGTPWTLVIDFDASTVLSPAVGFLTRMLALAAALLLLGAGSILFIGARFARPIRMATEAAESITAGNHGSRLRCSGPSEVRRLSAAFNTMAERVEDGRRELEQRVARRTEALDRALQELQRAQTELVRREKLATLGQLAGGVGHELRNPLGVMSNAIYYLEMILEERPAEVSEYLGIIRNQIRVSEKIIADLLDFGRERSPLTRPVALEQLAEEQVKQIPPGVELIRDYGEQLPRAAVDPVHAGQILHNLIENALHAMADGPGTLTLRTRRHDDHHVRIEIVDTGPGIPAELRERIFEPLFTTKPRGIGLGLAVSRQLAERNGGRLLVHDVDDPAGATFMFVLPNAKTDVEG